MRKSTSDKQESKKEKKEKKENKENKVKKNMISRERSELKEKMSKTTRKEKRNKKSNMNSDQSMNSESNNDNDSDTTNSNTSGNRNYEASDDDDSDSNQSSMEEENDEEEDSNTSDDSEEEENKKKAKKKKQTKINVIREYNTYFSVKVKVDKGAVTSKQLLKALKTFFTQLYLLDSNIAIYEYEAVNPSKAILKVKDIPKDYSIMKKFFSNISVKPNGGHTWFQMWIGHDEQIENILIDMKQWSSESDSHLYKKRLQEKFTAKDYWLLWSTERMDTEAMKDEIDVLLTKKIVNKMFQLSFNFGVVRKDTKYSNNTIKSKWNKAGKKRREE